MKEVFILQSGIKSLDECEKMNLCKLQTLDTTGINKKVKHYAKEMYLHLRGWKNKQISENEEEIKVLYCLTLMNEEERRKRWDKKYRILAKIFTSKKTVYLPC